MPIGPPRYGYRGHIAESANLPHGGNLPSVSVEIVIISDIQTVERSNVIITHRKQHRTRRIRHLLVRLDNIAAIRIRTVAAAPRSNQGKAP